MTYLKPPSHGGVGAIPARCRRPPLLTRAAAVVALSLLAAGCGGGGSPGVANVTSSTTATTTQTGAVAFARCMRSHGASNFPDPNADGVFDGTELKQLRIAKSELRTAQSACNHLLPNGIPLARPTITPADQADYLRGAACMRSHGFPGFPDPTFDHNGDGVHFNIPSSLNPHSPQARRAVMICERLIPRGLPYSGS